MPDFEHTFLNSINRIMKRHGTCKEKHTIIHIVIKATDTQHSFTTRHTHHYGDTTRSLPLD